MPGDFPQSWEERRGSPCVGSEACLGGAPPAVGRRRCSPPRLRGLRSSPWAWLAEFRRAQYSLGPISASASGARLPRGVGEASVRRMVFPGSHRRRAASEGYEICVGTASHTAEARLSRVCSRMLACGLCAIDCREAGVPSDHAGATRGVCPARASIPGVRGSGGRADQGVPLADVLRQTGQAAETGGRSQSPAVGIRTPGMLCAPYNTAAQWGCAAGTPTTGAGLPACGHAGSVL